MAECLSRVRQAPKKRVTSRGATASVAPGGDGFACPASSCKSVFDTPEEALEHGATHGLSGEREVDDEGKSCCLWQGCAKKIKVMMPSHPKAHFGKVQRHEAMHTKGPKPREGFVCPECDEAFPTSVAAWACAATHDVEEDPKKCLWAGCGEVFSTPFHYRAHEPVRVPALPRTAAWPPTPPCPEPPRPFTYLRCLSRPPLSRPTPRCVAEAHGTVAAPLRHVQQGPRARRCALRRATPHAQPANEIPHPSPGLGRVRDALLQGHRRVQVRLEPEGAQRPEELQGAQGALRPRRGARAAGLSRPARRPADGCRPRAITSHDAARAATRPPRARAPHEGRA